VELFVHKWQYAVERLGVALTPGAQQRRHIAAVAIVR
jgi:hypothetical protein